MPTVEKAFFKIQNLLLAALPENVFDKIEPSSKLTGLRLGEIQREMNEKRKHICLLYETEDGESIEVVKGRYWENTSPNTTRNDTLPATLTGTLGTSA